VHGRELIEQRQLREFQRVILVGLAFDLGPPPGFVAGIGDGNCEAQRAGDVEDPAADLAGPSKTTRIFAASSGVRMKDDSRS
jgi:hypothetical protein